MYILSHKIIPACLNIICLNLWLLTPIAQASCTQGIGTKTEDGKFLISGVSVMNISDYSGTDTNGVNVDFGSGAMPSGPISFTLDTNETNVIFYNFDSGYATLNLNLLLDIPDLGLLDQPLNLIESAILPSFNIIMPPDPPATNSLSFMSDGFVSQPLLSPQSSSFTGSGTIAAPTGDYKTLEFTDNTPLNFIGGGEITSGALTGFSYFNGNPTNPIPRRWFANISSFVPSGISNPPPNQPPNSPPPEYTDPIPNFPAYPTLPQNVEMCPVPEPSQLLGLLGISGLGVSLLLIKKNKITSFS